MQTESEVETLLAGISDEWWSDDPAPTRALLDRLEADAAAGPEQLISAWGRGVMQDYSLGRLDNPLAPALRYRLGDVAGRMAQVIPALPSERQGDLVYLRARLHDAAGQTAMALSASENALGTCGNSEGVTALRIALTAGQADPDAFAPEARVRLAAELPDAVAFYHSLGPLTAFNFLERQNACHSTTFRCRALFGNTPWIQSFVVNEAGQVIDFPLERRRAF